MIKRFCTGVTLAALMGLTLAATGCHSDEITAASLRADATPELSSTAASHQQDLNQYAQSIDNTTRQAWDDLAMILLIDKPVRMTDYAMP